MLKLKEAIVVEGTYDKIKLSQLVDTMIVATDGFDIYKNKKKAALIITLAQKRGIIILTDSDRAGFQIRNYVKNIASEGTVKHAYIPDVAGKEKRKDKPSKEGFLGVEGIKDDVLLDALKKSGCTPDMHEGRRVSKSDLFAAGLSGTHKSSALRKKLVQTLGLPARVSSNMLLDVINSLYTYEEYQTLVNNLHKEDPPCR